MTPCDVVGLAAPLVFGAALCALFYHIGKKIERVRSIRRARKVALAIRILEGALYE